MTEIQICSLNVRGLRLADKRRQIFYWLKKKAYNIILLQETHSTQEVESGWENEWGHKILFSHGSSQSAGVAVLFKNDFTLTVNQIKANREGRYLFMDILANEYRLTLANIYAPNEDRPEYFTNIYSELQSYFSLDNLILGGDFNCLLDVSLDKSGGSKIHSHPNALLEIESIMEDLDLVDIWRCKNPSKRTFTWHQRKPLVQCRLDYFLISYNIVSFVEEVNILPSIKTDHSLITLSLNPHDLDKGRGYWKFNTSLLNDSLYVENVKTLIKETISIHKDNQEMDEQFLWELIKMQIRGLTIQYASQKKRLADQEEKQLNEIILYLHDQYNQNPCEATLNALNENKAKLEKIIAHKAQGAYIRAKAQWYEFFEKNTKFFSNLEKRHHKIKTISKLKDKNGNILVQNNLILNEAAQFYANLYKSVSLNPSRQATEAFFPTEEANVIELTTELRQSLEGPLTDKECLDSIKSMSNGKSPGLDGFPVEFYKFFWQDLKRVLVDSLNLSLVKGEMSTSQKRGVLILLPKKEQDPLLISNKRPITLLNVDYKIVSKTIASRIRKVLPFLINEDQTGYVKSRYIGENIRLILDLIEYTETNKIPGKLMFVDFEKAFDSLEWEFITCTLKRFNFGPDIIRWFHTLYNNISSCVVNNGMFSRRFELSRGVRQGCPLSPYLFVLCAEILATAIRNDGNIKGVKVSDTEIKLSQFADDTTLIMDDSNSTLNNVFYMLEKFEEISGLKVNTQKTILMSIGPTRRQDIRTYFPHKGVKWKNSAVKMLGIIIEKEEQKLLHNNYVIQFEKAQSTLKRWANRNIGLRGKILVCKSFALSKLTYLISVLPNPSQLFVKKVNQTFFNFVWDNKPDKIKRLVMINDVEKGGLKVPFFQSMCDATKIVWVKRFLDTENQGKWKTILQTEMGKVGGNLIWKCNFKTDEKKIFDVIKISFLKNMLVAWSQLNFQNPCTFIEIQNQYLWFNSHIRINDQIIYYEEWARKGVLKIEHLTNDHTNFLTFAQFKDKFHINCNFLKYFSLIDAIPQDWKTVLKRGHDGKEVRTTLFEEMQLCKFNNRYVYSLLINKIALTPNNTISKWTCQLNIPNQEWSHIFMLPYKCTIEEKLRNFHFKLIHRILPTNVLLFKLSKVQTSNCSFCGSEWETLIHLFCLCKITQRFWGELKIWLQMRQIDISLEPHSIILGQNYINPNNTIEFVNLVAKYYIFCCKVQDRLPSLNGFVEKLKYLETIERHTSLSRDTHSKHTQKWRKLKA